MNTSIYHSLMKALTMEDMEGITCYPVCASASGAIAELIEVRVRTNFFNVVHTPLYKLGYFLCAFCRTVMLHLIGSFFCKRL